jgi:hypothetical protein
MKADYCSRASQAAQRWLQFIRVNRFIVAQRRELIPDERIDFNETF